MIAFPFVLPVEQAPAHTPNPIAARRSGSRLPAHFEQKLATLRQTSDRSATSVPVAACSIQCAPQCILHAKAHRNWPASVAGTFAANACKRLADIGAHPCP